MTVKKTGNTQELEAPSIHLTEDEILISTDSDSDVHTSSKVVREDEEGSSLVNAEGVGTKTSGRCWCDWFAELASGV